MLIPPHVGPWTPNENGYQLPAEIEDILIDAEQGDSGWWWSVARTLADFIAELPEAHRKTMRARVIRQAAVLRKVQPSTVRDAVHTAEVITHPVESDPTLSLLGWQHAVRAARVGDGIKALAILRQVVAESDDHGGQCPPVSRVNELVREANGREPAPKRRRWSGTVVSLRLGGKPHQIIVELDSDEKPPVVGDMLTLIEMPSEDEC